MRYWLLVGSKPTGPFEPGELQRHDGTGARSLVCPENRQPYRVENWRPASRFPELARLFGVMTVSGLVAEDPPPQIDPATLGDPQFRVLRESMVITEETALQRAYFLAKNRRRTAAAVVAGVAVGLPLLWLRTRPSRALPLEQPERFVLQVMPLARPGRALEGEDAARVARLLGSVRSETEKASLGELMGRSADWKAWPLDQARCLVLVRRGADGRPGAPPSLRLLYFPLVGRLRAADDPARALLGDAEVAVRGARGGG